jgi:tetratricopeptide (TPR) repeat protein
MATVLYCLDRFDDARAQVEKARKRGNPDAITEYNLALVAGDTASLQKTVDSIEKENPNSPGISMWEALGDEYRGRYRDADATWRECIAAADALGLHGQQAAFMYWRLSGRALADLDVSDVGDETKKALALRDSLGTRCEFAWVAAISNRPDLAQPLIDALEKESPDNTNVHRNWLPQTRAALALRQHKPQEALEALEGDEDYDLVTGSQYLRGLAYLELKDAADAIEAFEKVTSRPGAMIVCHAQDYPQAQLGLARAYALAGDTESARKAYQDFFKTWKDADPDLPQLVAAKREYAALERLQVTQH